MKAAAEIKINTLPISEINYEQNMLTVAEPYLAQHGGIKYFEGYDGNKLCCEQYMCENARGSVVIVHGFTESAEKFREMSYNFMCMGMNVFAIDNRGHANSFRYVEDIETVHINRFNEYVKDLDVFLNTVVIPASENLPVYLYCHSMGGAIGVQYLQEHPKVFAKAVLSAPMIFPQTMGIPAGVTSALMKLFIIAGQQKKMVFAYKGFNPNRTYENSHDTSKARFDYYQAKRCNNRHLQTAAPSYRWVSESVKVAKKNLDKTRCQNIDCPVLLCQPETDSSVISEKEDEFIALVKDGRLVKFANSRHEIYMSIDSTVLDYLKTIEKFFCE